MAGDILYTGANEYKLAGFALRRAYQAKKLGYFKVEEADDERHAKKMREYRKAMEAYQQELGLYEEAMKEYRAEVRRYDNAMQEYDLAVEEWINSPSKGRGPSPVAPKIKQPKKPKIDKPIEPTEPKYIASENQRKPTFKETVQEKKSIMARERAFILSDTFQILMGNSDHTGESILQELDRVIAEYDPTPYVPEIDPETDKPFTKKKWLKILQERSQANESVTRTKYLRKKAPKTCGVKA